MMILADLSDQALTGRLLQIRKDERRLLVECLGCLAELDRRKAVLSLGYGSLFSFCTEFLGMTKASAFRRTAAARLLAPVSGGRRLSVRWATEPHDPRRAP